MAYDFDGTDDYIEATSAVLTAAPLTLACWFNSDSTTVNQALLSLSSANGQNRFILQAAGGAVSGDPVRAITTAANTSSNADSLTSYTANTWHHAAATFESTTHRRAFIDGVGGTAETTLRSPTTINSTRIGHTIVSSARGQFTNGRIAEACIWNVALDDAEIASLADGYRPSLIRPSAIVFYVPLIREVADYERALSLTTSGALVAVHTRRIA